MMTTAFCAAALSECGTTRRRRLSGEAVYAKISCVRTGRGFSAILAEKIVIAHNIVGKTSTFCEKCGKGKYRSALASVNVGHEDICQNTTISYPATEEQRNALGFGEYYSYVPFEDATVKTATLCSDCGTSFCFKQRLEDGGKETCKSWQGIPDFSNKRDYFGN